METPSPLIEKISALPRASGVYLMKDDARKVIYVGKAKDLKSRVMSYFTGKDTRAMAPFLLSRVRDIDFITTATPKEALILENHLIKRHRPRYNVNLRDDKTYYHLSLDLREPFPRLQLVRKRKNDGALYFGPYPSGAAAKETLRFVQRMFPLRSCRDRDFRLRSRPCLEYQIGRCPAPCRGLIEKEAYRKMVEDVVRFLQGRRRELIADLKKKMHDAAENLDYEEAARLRDRLRALEHVLEKQNVDAGEPVDQDVFGIYRQDDRFQLCVLMIRDGKLLGSKSFMPVKVSQESEEVLSASLVQYYDAEAFIPDEIILPAAPADGEVIAEWLAEKKGKKVKLTVPVMGNKKAQLEMACTNARNVWETANKKEEHLAHVLSLLKEKLHLSREPHRLECYDISNIGGQQAVGSMIVFQDGLPDKKNYRRFRIRISDQPDDYGMMQEMLTRRFTGGEPLPDLVVVDGGKGQLNVALTVLRRLNIRLDVVGLAKVKRWNSSLGARGEKDADKKEDRVYLPGRKDAVFLSRWPQALRILQQARDEAHRFALSYHRSLKRTSDLTSWLDEMPEIGEKRKAMLLQQFGSVERIREASIQELQKVPGIGRVLAEKIHARLNKKREELSFS
jgi:excinuclease ABC subunit C